MPTFLLLNLSQLLTSESCLAVVERMVLVYQQIRVLKGLNICTWCSAGKWDLWASNLFALGSLLGNVSLQDRRSSFWKLHKQRQKLAFKHKYILNRIILNFRASLIHEIWIPLTKQNWGFVEFFFGGEGVEREVVLNFWRGFLCFWPGLHWLSSNLVAYTLKFHSLPVLC